MEGWEKVFVSNQEFAETIHGQMGCPACHGGDGLSTDKDTAHADLRRDPIAAEACDQCHTDTANHGDSLHEGLGGYYTAIQQRTSAETWPAVEEAFGNHCENCHTTCGQCHVSRPTNVGGGLSAGHEFKSIPPMNLTCTGCHGSRVNDEYKGQNEGVPADVHWNQVGMPCFSCHTADEMHGNTEPQPDHRYDGPAAPLCTDCHSQVIGAPKIMEHAPFHTNQVACQVCHVAEYKNCYSCHVQKSEDDVPYYKIDPSVMGVKIGRNPNPTEDRPWEWVVVRHVPVDPDTFAYYGDNLMPNFDNRPTWAYATPHAIQLRPPQAETCDSCHGNPDVFLTEGDLLPYEIGANKDVVVAAEDIPAPTGQ